MAEKVVKENKKSFDLKNLILNGGIYLVLLLLLVLIVMKDPTFLSLLNIQNILTQSSVRIIIALGVAGLIVTQGTDLSVGRQVGMAALVSATLLQAMTNVNKVFKGEAPEILDASSKDGSIFSMALDIVMKAYG